jgi:hypothetical protein
LILQLSNQQLLIMAPIQQQIWLQGMAATNTYMMYLKQQYIMVN